MPTIDIGNVSARIVSQELDFDPQNGWVLHEIWEGSESAMYGIQATYAASGYRARVYQERGAPDWMCDAYRPPDGSEVGTDEEVTDQWEFDSEFIQESIYANPNVVAAYASESELSKVRGIIESTLKDDGTEEDFAQAFVLEFAVNPGDFDYDLWRARSRGQQAHEIRRIVLRRLRSLPINDSRASEMLAVENVYTSAALADVAGIPSGVYARMPVDPSTSPSGTAWSWKLRRDNQILLPRLNKAQETREWVFAAWSTLTYNLIV